MMDSKTNKIKILIADDEASVRKLLVRSLTERDFDCTEVPDGSKALQEMASGEFDVVLLDINMPVKSGIETLKEITSKYPDTAVVMVTSLSSIETAIESMKQGAYDYVLKPVDLDMLMVSIDKALDKRRLVLENKNYQHTLEETVHKQTNQVRKTFYNSITSLVYALEAKDKYTSGHSQRVSNIAESIGNELGLSEEKLRKLKFAGLVHDIGKIGVRESILNKSGKLTAEEYKHIMTHCELGEHILSPVIEDKEILDMVKHHHEHYDGNGYPHKLKAEEIPEGAKIIAVADAYCNLLEKNTATKQLNRGAQILAVADAYDAMTSDRPYRDAMSMEDACAELIRGKGKQFDPVIVDALLRIITTDKLK
jgi:putative nucleotidyltransferase with HDIG domain